MAPRAGRTPGGVPKFWTQSATALAIEEIEVITEAALALSGQDVTVTDAVIDIVTVDSGALTLAGQAIVETERIGITVANLSLAGQDVAETEVIPITPATLEFAFEGYVGVIDPIDPVEPPVAAAGGGRGWWRRRRRRERENIEIILRDLLLPEAVTGPVRPSTILRDPPRKDKARTARRLLLATTSLQDELSPPRAARGLLGFDPDLFRSTLDSPGSGAGAGLPRISSPPIHPEPDEDEEEIALLLAILFDDGVPHVSSPPIFPSLDEEEEEIAGLLAILWN